MNTSITVLEVMDKEQELKNNIQKLLTDFKDGTGFYVNSIYVSYCDSLKAKRDVTLIEIDSRINS